MLKMRNRALQMHRARFNKTQSSFRNRLPEIMKRENKVSLPESDRQGDGNRGILRTSVYNLLPGSQHDCPETLVRTCFSADRSAAAAQVFFRLTRRKGSMQRTFADF